MTKRDTVNAAMALLFALFASASARADLFDEAVGWYCGGTDSNADGVFANGELLDRRHAGVPGDGSHRAELYSHTESDHSSVFWTNDTVACAVSGETLSDQQCLLFRQMYTAEGQDADLEGALSFPLIGDGTSDANVISTNQFTVLIRFKVSKDRKLANGTDITSPTYEYLFSVGDNAFYPGGFGLTVGLKRETGRITYSTPNWTSDPPRAGYYWEESSTCCITNDTYTSCDSTWNELAVVSYYAGTTPTLRYYLYQPGLPVQTWANGGRVCLPEIPSKVVLGSSLTRLYSSLAWNKTGFRGSVHFFAAWNRVLSQAEIEEAFRTTSDNGKDKMASVFKLGNDAFGHELFGGGNEGVARISSADPYVTGVPASFAVGTKLVIDVPLDESYRGAKQIFRIRAADGSAHGTFALKANGESVGMIEAASGKSRCVLLPEYLFSSSSVQLEMECVAAGAGGVALSTIEMGGSWQIGLKNKANTEFGGVNIKTFVVGVNDATNFPIYTDVGNSKSESLGIYLPDGTEREFVYEFRTSIYAGHINPTLRFSVNDHANVAEKAWLSPNRNSNEDIVVKIPPELLVSGTNWISWVNVGTNGVTKTGSTDWNWGYLDYCSFSVQKRRGCFFIVVR